MRLKIASRKSDLARIQAYQVGDLIQQSAPGVEVEFDFSASLGDKNLDDPLWTMGDKGVFTQDFYDGLVNGAFDLVVHSWKDLPTEERGETELVGTIEREDSRDVLLVSRETWAEVEKTGRMVVLTSSPRRMYNMASFLKWAMPTPIQEVEFRDVRGNVPTRISKLLSGQGHALVAAKAGLDRLLGAQREEFRGMQKELRQSLSRCRWMVLPLRESPAAAAQGALALEIKKDRPELRELLSKITKKSVEALVEEERKVLGSYGGGCHQKIGITRIQRPYGQVQFLRGETEGGEVLDEFRLIPSSVPEIPKAESDQVFPVDPKESSWYERQPLPREGWENELMQAKALWVARETSLPDGVEISPETIVWASGLKTWRKLAERGIWVHGSAEGLGESEAPQIEALLGKSPQWMKLTHKSATAFGDYYSLATYRLTAKPTHPDLTGKTHFYWMSGSSFLRALSFYPWLKDQGYHACGPGHTYDILSEQLGPGAQLNIFLDHSSWLSTVVKGSSN